MIWNETLHDQFDHLITTAQEWERERASDKMKEKKKEQEIERQKPSMEETYQQGYSED